MNDDERNLWEAATNGDIDKVKELLSIPTIDVNWGDEDYNRTAFYRACGHGRTEVVQLMLEDPRIDVNKIQNEGLSPFYVACQEGHLDVVKLLMKGDRVDVAKERDLKATPFFVACSHGRTEIVKLLAQDKRIDINKPEHQGATPLNLACQEGYYDIVQFLVKYDHLDINYSKHNGATPLFVAAQNGEIEIVKLLLAQTRYIDTTKTWKKRTALDQAKIMSENGEHTRRQANCPEIVKLLKLYEMNPKQTKRDLRRELRMEGFI